jgi:cysteine desulfuration protein SufE
MATLDEIKEVFALTDDWEERYAYLIDLGRRLPEMPEEKRTAATKVNGCLSQVWLDATLRDGRFCLLADADALMVKGLIAVLLAAYNQQTPQAVLALDAGPLFDELGLGQHLTANRRNGFLAMIARVRALAEANLSR